MEESPWIRAPRGRRLPTAIATKCVTSRVRADPECQTVRRCRRSTLRPVARAGLEPPLIDSPRSRWWLAPPPPTAPHPKLVARATTNRRASPRTAPNYLSRSYRLRESPLVDHGDGHRWNGIIERIVLDRSGIASALPPLSRDCCSRRSPGADRSDHRRGCRRDD